MISIKSNRKMYLVTAFFLATILMLSSMTAQIAYSTITEDPGTYMTGQRIATSEEMGIKSLREQLNLINKPFPILD